MSEPTAYDLTQDEKIAEHSELLQVSDVAATGNQISYPVVGQPISESMWGNVTRGIGNGVLDQGDSPYYMALADMDNANNTAIIRTGSISGEANAIINGFFHQLTENHQISLPAVTKTTTYSVCLTFDPLKSQAADGPISIQVYAGDPPTTGGKIHVVLYEVTRAPNSVLTDATVKAFRPRIAPHIYVAQESELPTPTGQLWGTIAIVHTTGEHFIAVSDGNNSGPDYWKNLTKLAAEKYANIIIVDGVEYRRSGRATFSSAWVNVETGALWRSEELVININQTPPPGWHYVISCSVDSGGINLLVGRASYTKTDKPRIVFFSPAKLDRLKIYADWHLEADQ